MKDKLAEEILKKHIATIVKTGDKEYDDFYRKSIVLQAMQAYHESKLRGEA